MANDTKKPGAEPGKSQARLDRVLQRVDGFEETLESLNANTSKSFDEQSKAIGELTQSVAGMGEKLAAVDGLQSSVEQNGKDMQASAKAQSELAAAIARRDQLIDERLGQQDATIKMLAEALSKLLASDESAAAKAGMAADQTTKAIELLGILAGEQRTAAAQHQTLAEAVAAANEASATDRAAIGLTVEGIDTRLGSIEGGVKTNLGQVVKLRRKTVRIGIAVNRIERNVERMLALIDVVIQGVEASQVYLAEVQFSMRSIDKGMLTTSMFFKVNNAMKADLVKEMNKLPEDLKRSVKDILQAAARIKHEAETSAANNQSQLGLVKAQVDQLINYYSTEGQGVINLLRDSATQFNTRLSNEIGKANLLLDQQVEAFLEGARKKIEGFAEQLKAGDFYKVLEGLGAAYTNAQNLTKEISQAIADLDTASEEVKAEIRDKVDQIKFATKSLTGDIHNARTDIGAVTKSFGSVREYLVETNSNLLAYMEDVKDARSVAQGMVAADKNAQLAFYESLFEKLVTMVVGGVSKENRVYFEQIGLGILTQDLDSSNDTDE